jgi:hypothetical protein
VPSLHEAAYGSCDARSPFRVSHCWVRFCASLWNQIHYNPSGYPFGAVETEGKRVCEVCGNALNSNSDFCPVCALRGAVSAETESLSDASELRFEHYQVLKNDDGTPIELGRGGMGVTYKAIDTIFGAQLLSRSSVHNSSVTNLPGADSYGRPEQQPASTSQCGHGTSPGRKRRGLLLCDGICGW